MRTHRRRQLCLAVFLLTLAGCAEKTAPPQTAAPETPTPPPPAAATPPPRPAPTPPPPAPAPPPVAAAPVPPPPPAAAPAPAAPASPEFVEEPALKDVFFDAGHTDIG